jgi:hypothetical protein
MLNPMMNPMMKGMLLLFSPFVLLASFLFACREVLQLLPQLREEQIGNGLAATHPGFPCMPVAAFAEEGVADMTSAARMACQCSVEYPCDKPIVDPSFKKRGKVSFTSQAGGAFMRGAELLNVKWVVREDASNTQFKKKSGVRFASTPLQTKSIDARLDSSAFAKEGYDEEIGETNSNEIEGVGPKLIGFGGAFTDAAAFVFFDGVQDKTLRQNMLDHYFSKSKGIGYAVGRVPMGSCDFSRRSYELQSDPSKKNHAFCLLDDRENPECGKDAKLDLIKLANAVKQSDDTKDDDGPIQIFFSPWSAPPWMKEAPSQTQREEASNMKGMYA